MLCQSHVMPLTHCLLHYLYTLFVPLTALFVPAGYLSATPPHSPAQPFTDLVLLPQHTIHRNNPPLLVRRPTPSLLNPPFWFFLFTARGKGLYVGGLKMATFFCRMSAS